ncbi:D-isomer specific 2-hydroxyacid dehydrogenase, NAD binding domain protein [Paraburkholderia xenovorans LB400]|uniref:2-hydroxy-3-oxopropionate reductase n=1 Tax=Paraburkholderia xenovorans (strain LB400) TaxID=266265 RepID=Q13J84_PARXL|nr:NAD(P)-dependent oxidoreductase [Paraburkholderia xenovorans]ABE35855.1 2-hydroxy-3-oxopropionate reductase [Paraburkholderia xenovorans LB400]AIP37180.1 D-isomer specific 2-hydroxyacid dehydrogenase, NAD binding domain protein [Paraburkholderia xenovorans LB400]
MNHSENKAKVGFIGLGIMGGAMATRVAAADYPLHVYNRSRAKAQSLVDAGATWHDTPASLAAVADVIISIVGTPTDVRDLYLGNAGLLANARPAAVLIDMTTSSPALAQQLARDAQARSIDMLDAPVSGGEIGAREGRLSIMVGGSAEALARVEAILHCMGTNVVLQGGPGAGQHTKLCNQIVIASTMLGVAEGLSYARNAGLDVQTVLSSIGSGAASGFLLNNLGPKMANGDFAPGFMIEHFVKDMALAYEEALAMGHELPGLQLAQRLYQQLVETGFARAGTQALVNAYAWGKTDENH